MFRIFSWMIALALAVFVGLSSFSIANRLKAPGVAYALGVPYAAAAGGDLAARSLATRQSRNPESRVSKSEQRLALRAFQSDPLSPSALSILIAAKTAPAESQQRQALLDLGGKLSRRNAYVSTEQIEAAALREDNKAFFVWLSRLILTNNDLRPVYIKAMADATARAGSADALAPVLGPEPDWADDYWDAVVQRRASLVNAAGLRMALARAPWQQTTIASHDKVLSIGLARIGEFATAQKLSQVLSKSAETTKGGNLLQNGSFSRLPLLPPFDWELTTTGNLGSSIDVKSKALVISAIGGARGSAARQLVQLAPGNYRLGWTLASDAPIPQDALSIRVACAEQGTKSAALSPIVLGTGSQVRTITIPDGSCGWYWVSLYVGLADDAPGIDAYIRGLSLVSGSAKQGAAPPRPDFRP